jgi:hypothetical protein
MKEIVVSHDKRIQIFDNQLQLNQRQQLYLFIINSSFRIGWADTSAIEKSSNQLLHSIYSNDDLARFSIFDYIQNTEISKELEGYQLEKAVVNLSNPSDYNFVHAHPCDKVLLYYANLDWHDGWHGETLFFDEPCKEVVHTSPYTPGRFILFDGSIPHTIRPQSVIAAKYRFTFAATLNKNTCSN